ncbi:MAG: DNA polymerase III subunit alpha, partial [Bacteroidetes bacterium]
QLNAQTNTNTLFGDLNSAVSITKPVLPPCEQYTLTDKLNYEKEVTGMFMSGHPLDNFKFELKYYSISSLSDFNQQKDGAQPPVGKPIKLVGIVTAARQGNTKTGKAYSVFSIEDYSDKTEFFLWSNDAARYAAFLEPGRIVLVKGSFEVKETYDANRRLVPNGFKFNIDGMQLLDSLKTTATKALELQLNAADLTLDFVDFFTQNLKTNPGACTLKLKLMDKLKRYDLELALSGGGFAMNDALSAYLLDANHIDVSVSTS